MMTRQENKEIYERIFGDTLEIGINCEVKAVICADGSIVTNENFGTDKPALGIFTDVFTGNELTAETVIRTFNLLSDTVSKDLIYINAQGESRKFGDLESELEERVRGKVLDKVGARLAAVAVAHAEYYRNKGCLCWQVDADGEKSREFLDKMADFKFTDEEMAQILEHAGAEVNFVYIPAQMAAAKLGGEYFG